MAFLTDILSAVIARFSSKTVAISLIYTLVFLPVSAQSIKIGLFDDINRIYISANQDYQIIEDRSPDQGSFLDGIVLLERKAGHSTLLRSSPQAANDLVIAAEPNLMTSSSHLKFRCRGPEPDRIKISEFSSEKYFNDPENYRGDYSVLKQDSKSKPCIFQLRENKFTRLAYAKYRGELLVIPQEKSFTLINHLDLEDYLKGVLPSEMPVTWPLEALKAQAVAARTYSYANLGRRSSLGYDLKSTVEDQKYLGYERESLKANKALATSRDEVMLDKFGGYVDAYYYSSAGTYSAYPEFVWGIAPKSYLVPVKDPASSNTWVKNFNFVQLNDKFSDLALGGINAVTVLERSPEGRVSQVLVSGASGHKLLSGEEFRHHLGLRSTNFVIKKSAYAFSLSGSGFGHGIGMSQYGAKALAESGKNYQEILQYFYTGVKLSIGSRD